MRTIEVRVSSAGETSIQTKGYSGADCLQASRWLEHALGTTVNDTKSAEYHAIDASESGFLQQE